MSEMVTAEQYEQAKQTLPELERQLAVIDRHTELDLDHLASDRRSCKMQIRQALRQIQLYEDAQNEQLELAGVS